MTHPITPPPDKIHNWCQELKINGDRVDPILIKAAQWGANQMLNACLELIQDAYSDRTATGDPRLIDKHFLVKQLRAILAPKPPTLKQKALEAIDSMLVPAGQIDDARLIRRALEELPDD